MVCWTTRNKCGVLRQRLLWSPCQRDKVCLFFSLTSFMHMKWQEKLFFAEINYTQSSYSVTSRIIIHVCKFSSPLSDNVISEKLHQPTVGLTLVLKLTGKTDWKISVHRKCQQICCNSHSMRMYAGAFIKEVLDFCFLCCGVFWFVGCWVLFFFYGGKNLDTYGFHQSTY